MKKIRDNNIDLAIVTREAFPIGMAATNRILSYGQVLAKQNKVKVYISKPTEERLMTKNTSSKGTINQLSYEYVSGTTIWPYEKSKLHKLKVLLDGYLKLFKSLKKDNPKTIIIYSRDIFLRILLIYFFAKSRIIIEENEYPKILKLTKSKLKQKIHLSLYSKCDGVMVMTKELAEYYKKVHAKNIFILPMTVDIKRFSLEDKEIQKTCEKHFIYVGGNGGVNRDGLESMVKGFHIFLKNHPDYEFHIIGPIEMNDENIKKIVEYIKDNKLSNDIIFKGVYNSDKIPEVLKNATGIIMTPQKDFESGGFPTKLGEFLASGTSVITTDISELTHYLDNSNSYIVKPGETYSIAEKMEEIVLYPELALEIGRKGQKVAREQFNAETYLIELIEFLNLSKK